MKAHTPERVKFKVDKPAHNDEFGVHERIADAIVEVVREQPDIKMIGLLGGWGSGKSTIVGLVKRKLSRSETNSEIRCFVYDAWLRQSEPPRRAFLEGLVAFLGAPDGQYKYVESELDHLVGRRETVEVEATVTLPGPAKLMIILLAFLPIGLKLIGTGTIPRDVLDKFHVWPLELFWPPALFILGWTFTIAPFAHIGWLHFVCGMSLDSIVGLFINKHPEIKRETRVRRPEPSAIEFQALFKRIIDISLKDPRDILIVIDNLDRLPPEEALTLWAAMRGFFLDAQDAAMADTLPASIARLPTVLVPIDPAAPGRIHRGGANTLSAPEGAPAEKSGLAADAKISGLSQAFVDKTFDLVFHVPPPKLSGWQHYLAQRLRLVFREELPQSASEDVRVIYEAFHRKTGASEKVTPRELNSFVNSIAVLWVQHRGGDISLATMAYFVCDRASLTGDLHSALAQTTVDLVPYDPDWRRGLAALAFGVGKADADELYMKEPIREAIESSDPGAFRRLSSDPVFGMYLDQVLEDVSAVSALAAARVIAAAAIDADWTPRIWRRLCRDAPRHLEVRAFQAGDDIAIADIYERLAPSDRQAFLRRMCDALGRAEPPRLLAGYGLHAAAVASELVRLASGDGFEAFPIMLGPGRERVFTCLIGQASSVEVRRVLHLDQPADVAVSDAEAAVRGPDLEVSRLGLRALSWFAEAGLESQAWSSACEAVLLALKSNDVSRAVVAAHVLMEFRRWLPSVEERLNEVQRNGDFLACMHRFIELPTDTPDADRAIAATIALTLKTGASPEPPSNRDWMEILVRHPGLSVQLDLALSDLLGSRDLGSLWGLYSSYPRHASLIRSVANARLNRTGEVEAREVVLSNLSAYVDLLQDADGFWSNIATKDGFWSAARQLDLQAATPLYVRLMKGMENRAPLGRHLQSVLNAVQSEQWQSALDGGAAPMELVTALGTLPKSKIEVGHLLARMLEATLPSIITNADGDRRARWFTLVRWTEEGIRVSLLNKISISIVGENCSDPVQMLLAGAALLAGPTGLAAIPSSLGIVLPRLLGRDDAIIWLVAQRRALSDWIERGTASERARVEEAVLGLAQRNAPDAALLRETWFPTP